MTESATREFLIDVLRKAFPSSNIYTGQKRVVVVDPTNPTMVYKIAYNNAGILDNINEVATSDALKGLVQSGQIPADALNCFALSALTPDSDPFVIVQEYVQKNFKTVPIYELISEKGPDHMKEFEIQVVVGKYKEKAVAKNKKKAEQLSAKALCVKLGVKYHEAL